MYQEDQKKFGCRSGDVVRIFKQPDEFERVYWGMHWDTSMNLCVGRNGTVINVNQYGILVRVPGVQGPSSQAGAWYFPYTSLNILR